MQDAQDLIGLGETKGTRFQHGERLLIAPIEPPDLAIGYTTKDDQCWSLVLIGACLHLNETLRESLLEVVVFSFWTLEWL